MEKITRQAAFDKVWKHFVVDRNERSIMGSACVYGEGCNSCAFGILIPMDKRHLLVEGKAASHHFEKIPEIAELFEYGNVCENRIFYNRLQRCHDWSAATYGADFHREIEDKLKYFAVENGVNIPL